MILLHLVRFQDIREHELMGVELLYKLYPVIKDYIKEHVFNSFDDSENLIVLGDTPTHMLRDLMNDFHFILIDVWSDKPEDNKPVHARERACQVMAKIKGIDPEDASRVLDAEWDYIKKKQGR